jgi:hypothetical protein
MDKGKVRQIMNGGILPNLVEVAGTIPSGAGTVFNPLDYLHPGLGEKVEDGVYKIVNAATGGATTIPLKGAAMLRRATLKKAQEMRIEAGEDPAGSYAWLRDAFGGVDDNGYAAKGYGLLKHVLPSTDEVGEALRDGPEALGFLTKKTFKYIQ